MPKNFKFLEVVTPTDIPDLLRQIPLCVAIVTTGQKATDTLCNTFGITPPQVGYSQAFCYEGRQLRLYRMPSSSRAYPMSIEKKSDFYRKLWEEVGML